MDKKKKLEKQIALFLSEIITEEMDNPIFSNLSINDVKLNNDNSIANIYVDFYNKPEETLGKLKGAGKFIRQSLAKRLDIRKVPFLEFLKDDKLEKINQIEDLIKEIK